MNKQNHKEEMNWGALMWLIFIVCMILSVMFNNGGSSSSSSSSAPSSTGSADYRYAKERFRQEGFTDSEASEAASAVLKFHEAQKARRGY